jgi:hypothetical protein
MPMLSLVPDLASPVDALLTAAEVGKLLRVATKKVYELPIPKIVLSPRRIRYSERDVRAYVERSRAA